jgi:lipopolysaccharide cholinephosphotransferase
MSKYIKYATSARDALNSQDISDLLIEIDEETRHRLQISLTDMYRDILHVCQDNNIVPYLIGGSALGAIRHKGFIPWDDDIDIGMTRSDYEKFVELFNVKLADKYILNAPNVSENPKARFTKIYKKGTVCREVTDSEKSVNGIFLDIFLIENIPANKIIRKIKGTYCNALQFISGQVYLYENNNPILKEMYSRSDKKNYEFRMWIGKLFSFRSSVKWFNSVDKAARYKETGIYGIVTGRKHYFGEIFNGDVFFPHQYVQFEDIKAPVFHDTDTYLKNLYRNYMELPPVEKRERHCVIELKF